MFVVFRNFSTSPPLVQFGEYPVVPDMVREQDHVSGNTVSGDIAADALLHAFDRCILLEAVRIHHARCGGNPASHYSPLSLSCLQCMHINKDTVHLVCIDSYHDYIS